MFGQRSEKLRDIIVASIRETHDQHAAGQQLMDPKGRRGYGGSIWVKLPNNLCSAIQESFLEATVWRGGHSGYSLPVLDGCVLYVWRTPGGKPSDEVAFLTSDIRGMLVDGVSAPPTTLFEGHGSELDSEDVLEQEEVVAQAITSEIVKDGLKLVLIVVESTPERLHQVKWGEVTRGHGADLNWLSEEIVYAFEEEAARPVPVPERTFADGPLPETIVVHRTEATNDDG